jgi:hypothetical protein
MAQNKKSRLNCSQGGVDDQTLSVEPGRITYVRIIGSPA